MLASFLAATFFALNATCASHSVRASGSARANLGRLLVAAAALGLFAHTLGHGFTSASVGWFFLSGLIGMGLGDLGVYGALPLLGSRLTVLMTQCLAAPIAAFGEWLWLDTRLTGAQLLWGVVVLAGVIVALLPSRAHPPQVALKPIGFLFGILAGLVFTALWFLALRCLRKLPARPEPDATSPARRRARMWILANGLAGPVLGVGCYQWALATTPSGIVLPIAATAPLLSIPIAFWLEGDRPTRRSLIGGVIAVAGCIALTLQR